MSLQLDKALRNDGDKADVSAETLKRCRARAREMLRDVKASNHKQHAMIVDPGPYVSGICPRRAGKTFAAVLAALIVGESKPGAITLIVSLNKQQLRRLYWEGATSGIWTLAAKYGLNLKYHNTYLQWTHENGSHGYLLGADDDEQLEVMRGLEADLYVIDECKSFAPARLETLIKVIIEPQRATRKGRLMLIGTPGHVLDGPFFQATSRTAHARQKCQEDCPCKGEHPRRFMLPYGEFDPHGRTAKSDRLYSCHHWTLEDSPLKHQWDEAVITKRLNGWADDDPTWRREYRGEWDLSADGLVFRYGPERSTGRVTWVPQRTPENPTGLPTEYGPWRFIAGLDLGYEAPCALVIAAYNQRLGELRHVFDYSRQHLTVPQIAEMCREAIARFGHLEKIFVDGGNLGKTIVATLARDGLPVEMAEKREKFDYIELLNSGFTHGEVKIIEGTVLEEQLLTNAWNLGDGKKEDLARRGALREDKDIPNDSTDALLYLYRGSLHHFRKIEPDAPPVRGTPAWIAKWEADQLARARREETSDRPRNALSSAPRRVAAALGKRWKLPTRGSSRPS